MATSNNIITFRVSQNLKEAVNKLSAASNRSMTSIIIDALKAYMTDSSSNYTDEQIILSVKKIYLLLLAQKPDISLLQTEVNRLLCLLEKKNFPSCD